MRRILPVTAGAALILAAATAHAASPGLGTSGTPAPRTNPGAIGGTQQSLQPTNPGTANDLNTTAPTVDTSPGSVGGPSYNPSSESPADSPTSSGASGADSSSGG